MGARPGWRSLRNSRKATIAVGTAITRLTYRLQRQEIAWVSTPPSSSPSEAPPAAIALKIPNALGRSRPGSDEHPERLRHPADRRRDREAREPADQRPFATEQVAELAPQQQKAAEGKGVCRDDPLPAVGREVQRPLRRGERDVHDRRIEHDHQLGDTEQGQHGPPVGVRDGGSSGGAGAHRGPSGRRRMNHNSMIIHVAVMKGDAVITLHARKMPDTRYNCRRDDD